MLMISASSYRQQLFQIALISQTFDIMSISLLWLVNKFIWVEEVFVRDASKAFLVKTYN